MIALYLADNLMECLQKSRNLRQMYLIQKAIDRKSTTYDSHSMTKVFVVELAALVELMKLAKPQQQQSHINKFQFNSFTKKAPNPRDTYKQMAHDVLESIPLVVK